MRLIRPAPLRPGIKGPYASDPTRPNFLADALAGQRLPETLSHLTQYAQGAATTDPR